MVAALIGSGIAVLLLLHTIINSLLLRTPLATRTITESVAILVPCRNEAHNIVELLHNLQAQEALKSWQVVLLDDNSDDETLVLANAAADDRTQVIAGNRLPDGWLGKPYACHQLSQRVPDADVLVFIDADVRLAPTAIAQAVATLRERELGLISPYPAQIARSWSERLVQPLLHWSWLATLPLRIAERSSRPSLTAANGQFLVVDRAAYQTSGGHLAIKDRVLDDMELLKSFKRHGYQGVVIDGSEIASCRMYTSWKEVEQGYTKWLWAAFGSVAATSMAAFFLAVTYLLPVVLLPISWPLALTSYAAGVLSRMISAVRTKGSLLGAFLHPLSIVLLIYLMTLSWIRKRSGSTSWKGRVLTT